MITTQTTNPITAFRKVETLELAGFDGKHQDGRKRNNWWLEGIKEYWAHITNPAVGGRTRFTAYNGVPLNTDSKIHLVILDTAAEARIGLKGDNGNNLTTHTKIMLGWQHSK